jgi:hypothetical protein
MTPETPILDAPPPPPLPPLRLLPDELADTPDAALDLDAELATLRQLLRRAVTAAEQEPPRDPFLAATRLVDAIARCARAQRELRGTPASAAERAMLEALAELGLGEA